MNKMSMFLAAIFFFLPASLSARQQEAILIQNGTIVPVVGENIIEEEILIQQGIIAEIGKNIRPPVDAHVIDAGGLYVYPGLIAPMTSIGITGAFGTGNDVDEIGESTPQMDPYDALNPEDDTIEVTRIDGITTVLTASGSENPINGKSVAINLAGDFADDLVLERYAGQIFNTSATKAGSYPSTLPGVASFIRDKLNQVKYYEAKKQRAQENGEPWSEDPEIEALIPVIRREVPAIFLTHNVVTVRNALKIIEEYGLRGIIHASEDVEKFADQLASENIPVIWRGAQTVPRTGEPFDSNYRTAAVLSAKGVRFALDVVGWGPYQGDIGPHSHDIRNLPVAATLSIAHGLSEREAIEAMTIRPAQILGIDDRVGSLEVGKIANIVIWNGSPFQVRSRVHTVIINGEIIPLTSYQTRLRDTYGKIVEERSR